MAVVGVDVEIAAFRADAASVGLAGGLLRLDVVLVVDAAVGLLSRSVSEDCFVADDVDLVGARSVAVLSLVDAVCDVGRSMLSHHNFNSTIQWICMLSM